MHVAGEMHADRQAGCMQIGMHLIVGGRAAHLRPLAVRAAWLAGWCSAGEGWLQRDVTLAWVEVTRRG